MNFFPTGTSDPAPDSDCMHPNLMMMAEKWQDMDQKERRIHL